MNTVLSLIIMISQNTIRKDNMNFIASYIIDHLYEIDAMSIKTLAENCYTSDSNMILSQCIKVEYVLHAGHIQNFML